MNELAPLAQITKSLAESDVGVPVTNLISSLGTAGAAVIVTYYFLSFLKDQEQWQKQIVVQFEEYHGESQRKFQEQLNRLADLQEASQRDFQEQVSRITESQNAILRESILAMKSIEKTTEGSSATIRGIQATIDSLQLAVRVIDTVVRRSIDDRAKEGSQPPSQEKLP
jgi:ferritin-like protein